MQRPRTITLVAWIFIVVGAAGLLKDLWPLLTTDAARQLDKLIADGLGDIIPAWTLRVLAVVAGTALLRGRNWARWVLVAWMLFHIGRSLFHSVPELLMHGAVFVPILYLLFRRSSESFFHHQRPATV